VGTSVGRQLRLLASPGAFRLLFLATLGSGLGTWMATIALAADLTARTHSPWWISALFAVTLLPSIVVGLAFGPLVDRLSRRRLIVAADLVRLAVFALLPFVDRPATLIGLAAVAGIANSFFRPAVLAGVPNLVEPDELALGTALLQVTDWFAAALGPVIGGALVSLSGPHVVYFINAGTFLFSAVLILRIAAPLLQSEQAITRGHWRDLREGIGEFGRSPALRTALFAFGFAMLAGGLNNVTEIFLAERSLHRGAFGYGLLWSGTGVGLVVGGLFASWLAEQRELKKVYPLAFLPWGIGLLAAGVSPNIWVAAAAMVVAGLGNGLTFPLTVLIVQRYTPDRVRGRAFTVIISAHNALLGVALVAAGELTNAVGPRWTYVVAAGLLGLGSLTASVLASGLRPQPSFAAESPA
jgi:DHA3 family macrolide efflux protein-like MFS transporter